MAILLLFRTPARPYAPSASCGCIGERPRQPRISGIMIRRSSSSAAARRRPGGRYPAPRGLRRASGAGGRRALPPLPAASAVEAIPGGRAGGRPAAVPAPGVLRRAPGGAQAGDGRRARIHRDARRVVLEDGAEIAYDRLMLSTGARSRALTCPGAELSGVHYLRGIGDVAADSRGPEARRARGDRRRRLHRPRDRGDRPQARLRGDRARNGRSGDESRRGVRRLGVLRPRASHSRRQDRLQHPGGPARREPDRWSGSCARTAAATRRTC